MINDVPFVTIFRSTKFFITGLLLFILAGTGIVNGATRYSVANGNWNAIATWAATSGGTAGQSVPIAGDDVVIDSNYLVTIDIATAVCSSIQLGEKNNGAGTLLFNTGSILTVSGDVTLGVNTGKPSSTGSIIMINGGLFKIGGALTAQRLGTWTPGTGTIEYNGTAQTVYANTYNNLTLSGSGAKTLASGIAINGNFTLAGTATTTGVIGLTIGGDVILGSGTNFTGGAFTHNVAGNWTNNGGTFANAGGTVNFTGNSSAINGTAPTKTFNNIIVAKTSGQTLSVGGGTTTLNVGGRFTETSGNFTAPATMSVTGNLTLTAGTFTAGTNLTATGAWTNNGGTFTPGTGTVTFTGNSSLINGTATTQTFYNVNVAKTAGQIISLGGSTTTLNVGGTFTETSGDFAAPATMAVTGNLTLTAGIFTAGTNLTASGAWTNNGGTFTPGTGTVTFAGNSSLINGTAANQTFYNVNGAKTAGQTISVGGSTTTLNVSNNLTITTGIMNIPPGILLSVINATNLNSSPSLVLQSNAASTGSFIHSDLFSGIGTVKVERFMSNTDNWHLYSSPMKDQSVHDFLKYNSEIPDLLDGSGNVIGVGMRDYNTSTAIWNPYLVYASSSTVAGSIGGGKGFSIHTYNDASATHFVIASGIPNPNTVNVSLTRSTATVDKGWNCIGNPYTSAINIKNTSNDGFLNTANASQLESGYVAVYVWDTNNITSSKTTPEYIVINNTTSIKNVQIGQGFFVKAKTGGGTVSFTKAMQNPSAALTFKDADIEWPSLKIIATNQTVSSSTEIKFITNTTNGLDPGYDAGMLKANPDFSLYSRLVEDVGIDFTLQCLPDQNYDHYEIPIGIDSKAGGELTFTAESVNLPAGCRALLEDRTNKTFTRLDLKNAKYTANVSADTKGTGRFFLHTSDVISGFPRLADQSFNVYSIGKTVYVNGEVSADAEFFVYSVNGKLLANFKAGNQFQNQLYASGLPAGIYVLTIVDKNLKKSVKFIIES